LAESKSSGPLLRTTYNQAAPRNTAAAHGTHARDRTSGQCSKIGLEARERHPHHGVPGLLEAASIVDRGHRTIAEVIFQYFTLVRIEVPVRTK